MTKRRTFNSNIDMTEALDWKLEQGQTLRQAIEKEMRKIYNISENTTVEIMYIGEDWPIRVAVIET